MPTYLCRASAGLLDDAARAAIATAITSLHREVTGADAFFAQVLFEDIAAGACFLGGVRIARPHVFVHGQIRAGRSAIDRAAIIERIVATIATLLSIPRASIWAYISELAPRAMAEYGSLLPEPGDEADWLARLPEDARRLLPS